MNRLDAWRLLDGDYRLGVAISREGQGLASREYHEHRVGKIREAGGRWDAGSASWVVPASAVDRLGAHRIFVVVAAGFCCRGPSRAEAREYEVRRRLVVRVFCPACRRRPDQAPPWEVPIVELCGEGEEGRLTYEAAFRPGFEG